MLQHDAQAGRDPLALHIRVWWGDALVHELTALPGHAVCLEPRDGGSILRLAGGFPSDRLTLAVRRGDGAVVMVPPGAELETPGLTTRFAEVPFSADWVALEPGRPVAYRMGPFRVEAGLGAAAKSVGRRNRFDGRVPRMARIVGLTHVLEMLWGATFAPPAP